MKTPGWQAICSATTAVISVVCMGSMAAAVATVAGAAGAGATSMVAMAGTGAAPPGSVALPLLPSLLKRIGLGFFNQLPNEILQPLLVVFLLASFATAYLAYRGHGRPATPILTALSGVLVYLSIYVWMSDMLYILRLIGLVAAGLLGLYLTRRRAWVAARGTTTA